MPAFLFIAFLAGDSTPLSQSQSSLFSADGGHPDISGRWAVRSAQSSVNSDVVGHVAQLDEFVQDSMTHVGAHRRPSRGQNTSSRRSLMRAASSSTLTPTPPAR